MRARQARARVHVHIYIDTRAYISHVRAAWVSLQTPGWRMERHIGTHQADRSTILYHRAQLRRHPRTSGDNSRDFTPRRPQREIYPPRRVAPSWRGISTNFQDIKTGMIGRREEGREGGRWGGGRRSLVSYLRKHMWNLSQTVAMFEPRQSNFAINYRTAESN